MPSIKPILSSLNFSSQHLAQCPGLAVTAGFTEWVINKFSFFIGFAIPIMENFGILRWYKSTHEEKERYISQCGNTRLYKVVTWIEENIEVIRSSFFVIYLIPNLYINYQQDQALSRGDCERVNELLEISDLTLNCYYKINLIFFVLYDIVYIVAKRVYIRSQRKNFNLMRTTSCSSETQFQIENSPSVIINPVHSLSLKSTFHYKESILGIYELNQSSRQTIVKRNISRRHSLS